MDPTFRPSLSMRQGKLSPNANRPPKPHHTGWCALGLRTDKDQHSYVTEERTKIWKVSSLPHSGCVRDEAEARSSGPELPHQLWPWLQPGWSRMTAWTFSARPCLARGGWEPLRWARMSGLRQSQRSVCLHPRLCVCAPSSLGYHPWRGPSPSCG